MAGQQKIRLRTDLEENLPTLSLDRRAMRQILFNLLSNSIKFSPAGGLVRVATERFSDEFVALTVMDEGCGMTEREVKQALLPFQQIAATDLKRGTGLGLPIAKALAEANDMQFAIESEKGVGTHAFMLIKI
jgi:signal transduction histidine kinase